MKLIADILLRSKRSSGNGGQKFRLDSKFQKFKYFAEKEGLGRSEAKSGRQNGMNCSSCLGYLEQAVKFKFTQLRNFERQAKRLVNKMKQIGPPKIIFSIIHFLLQIIRRKKQRTSEVRTIF